MRTRRRSGFTLVETIFSTLFISLTVLAIVNLFPGAYLSIRKSEATIQADVLGQSILDEVRLMRFDDLIEGSELKSSKPLFGPQVIDGMTYTPKVEILQTPAVAGVRKEFLKHVRVTVTYRLGISNKTVVFETYLHKLTQLR